MLKSALRKIYGYALVNRHIIPESQMTTIVVKISPLVLFMTYHRISNMINTARAPEFTHEVFLCCSYCSSWNFLCSVSWTIVGLFVLFIWPLLCLSYFDLRSLITPFESSNFSWIKRKSNNGSKKHGWDVINQNVHLFLSILYI